VHLEDARRRGVEIRGPCINRSAEGFIAEGRAVRVGLGRVKGLRAAAVNEILEGRAESPFKSLADLLARVSLAAPEAEALVLAGALDFAGAPRPSLLLEVLAWARSKGRTRRRGDALLAGLEETSCIRGIRDFDPRLRLEMEGRHLDFTPSGHPMGGGRNVLLRRSGEPRPAHPAPRPVACAALRRYLGRSVTVMGVVSASRRIRTEAGEPMLFLTIEDATGLVETVIFPGIYRSAADALEKHGPLLVTGTVEDHYGALTLVAEEVAPAMQDSGGMPASRCGGSELVENKSGDTEPQPIEDHGGSELGEGRFAAGPGARPCGRG
jgi:DNA polymerase III alpha subunit